LPLGNAAHLLLLCPRDAQRADKEDYQPPEHYLHQQYRQQFGPFPKYMLRRHFTPFLLDLPNLLQYASTLYMSSVAPLLMREGIMEKDFMGLREHRKRKH
jgi:hypothetical protein